MRGHQIVSWFHQHHARNFPIESLHHSPQHGSSGSGLVRSQPQEVCLVNDPAYQHHFGPYLNHSPSMSWLQNMHHSTARYLAVLPGLASSEVTSFKHLLGPAFSLVAGLGLFLDERQSPCPFMRGH